MQEFPNKILDLFENPNEVWLHVFENQITQSSRFVLINLIILKRPSYDNLFEQVNLYLKKNGIEGVLFTPLDFKKALKELENSMIRINKNHFGNLIIEYQNASIQDFLVSYIMNNSIIKENLFQSFKYLFPALSILIGSGEKLARNKIKLDECQINKLFKYVVQNFDEIEYNNSNYPKLNTDDTIIIKLYCCNFLIDKLNEELTQFISKKLSSIAYSENLTSNSLNEFIHLLIDYAQPLQLNIPKIIEMNLNSIWGFDEIMSFKLLKEEFPDSFNDFLEDNENRLDDIIYDAVYGFVGTLDEDGSKASLEEKKQKLTDIEIAFGYSFDNIMSEINHRLDYLEMDDDYYWNQRSATHEPRENNWHDNLPWNSNDDNNDLEDIFNTLKA